jgi:hypothetical protein
MQHCCEGERLMDKAPTWTPAAEAAYWLNEVEKTQGGSNGPTIKLRAAIAALGEPASATVEFFGAPHGVKDVERVAGHLAVQLAELRHEATRVLVAWDGTVLPKAHDGLMQERMESLRAALAVGAA